MQNKLLYIIRAESDFERVMSLAIAGKDRFKQHFVFVGDAFPFFGGGIKNEFLKGLFAKNGFRVKDFADFDFAARFLKAFSLKINIDINNILKADRKLLIPAIFLALYKAYIRFAKKRIIVKIFNSIKPDILLTDASTTMPDYLPEMFRSAALKRGIKVFIFTHGAAGGLHRAFSDPEFDRYDGCCVFACNDLETKKELGNRVILGDMCSSFPYVKYINNNDSNLLHFLDDKKYKIAFLQSGVCNAYTSTNAWAVMEEIIIGLSDNPDVAMVVKIHPRGEAADFRIISTFKNLLIVDSICDRSRVTKWADIVVFSDHCSAVFEPMILGKKVVAIEGVHVPKYKNCHSPLKHSSIKHIARAGEFDPADIPSANPEDVVTNQICWGNNGKADLAKLALEHIEQIINQPTGGKG